MVAPSWAASGTAFSGSGASVAAAVPSGIVAGQVAVLVMFLDGAVDQNVVAPDGTWTLAEGCPVVSTTHRLYVYLHRAAGNESGTYTFTWDASVFREGQVHRYTDCVASGALLETPTSTAVDNTSGTTTPAVSLTTGGADRLLLHAGTCWAGGNWTEPTGFTKRQQPAVGLCTLADKTQAVAGGTGNVTATVTNADKRVAWLGALKPVETTEVTGTASAALGGLSATATGVRTVLGTAAAALGGLGAAATGTQSVFGTASTTLGGLTAAATASGAGQQQSGGWDTLLAVSQYARQLRAEDLARPPVACPNDGEPLRTAPDGGLWCPWDRWRPGP